MPDPINIMENNGRQSNDPARKAFAVTPNDSADLPVKSRGLYLGASGNVVAILMDDTTPVTFTGLAAGVVHPLAVKRVLATGTTASGILALV